MHGEGACDIVHKSENLFGEPREKLYFVRETKGSDDPEGLRGIEQLKIACARRHFDAIAADVEYGVETNADEFRERVLRTYG